MELPDRCRFFLTERRVELGSSAKKHKKVKSTTLYPPRNKPPIAAPQW